MPTTLASVTPRPTTPSTKAVSVALPSRSRRPSSSPSLRLRAATSPLTLLRPPRKGLICRLQSMPPTSVLAPTRMSNDESSPRKRALTSMSPEFPRIATSLSESARPPMPAARASMDSAVEVRRGIVRSKCVVRMSGSPLTAASAVNHVPWPTCRLLTLPVKSETTPATSMSILLKTVCHPRSRGAK